jgi:hypothetical protein
LSPAVLKYARQDLNLQPLAPESNDDAWQAVSDAQVTHPESAICTPVCTNPAKEPNADPLAEFVASLTAEQRQRLVALLTGKREGGDDA